MGAEDKNADGNPLKDGVETAKTALELVDALLELLKKVGLLVRRHRAGQRVDDLDYLSFVESRFLTPLSDIAEGREVSIETAETLRRLLDRSAPEIEQSIDQLRRYTPIVRRDLGAALANQYVQIIDGPTGKFMIRYAIYDLIRKIMERMPDNEIVADAKVVLGMIVEFNAEIIRLHDLLLPPRGAPEAI